MKTPYAMKKILFVFFAFLMLTACSGILPEKGNPLTFTPSDEVIANPERGFYSAFELRPEFDPLTVDFVAKNRAEGRSLIYLGFYLTDFMESDISQEFLDRVEACFRALREGGNKCVLRFAYKRDMSEKGHPWDASEKWVLRHIEQLAPVMQRNEDVICLVQAGFVGVWGEWYYTDHFFQGPVNPEDYQPRKVVLDALLAAVPQSRQVGVRTPTFKMKIYGWELADTLTAATAHDGSVKSRVSGFNDCFGATANDEGTFDNDECRAYWKADTRYTFMGGETCAVSEYCRCVASFQDMIDYHWSYLNKDYNRRVLSQWVSEGCFDEIVNRLGYRLRLTEGWLKSTAKAGKDYDVRLKIQNVGFAAPMNPRCVELVLVGPDKEKTVYPLDCDPRTWYENTENEIKATVKLPETKGEYSVYLNLPDPCQSLHNDPHFSIHLANEGVWDEKTGYNFLTKITVK